MNIEELEKPLNPAHISVREKWKGGPKLSYIEAHHAIREANRIFGFNGWARKTVQMDLVQAEQKESNNKTLWYVGYSCKVQITAGNVLREGTGFGQGQDADLGGAHESAIKEAESDAMKRALMTFGDQFGLALYDKDQTHVAKPIVEAKKAGSPHEASAAKIVKDDWGIKKDEWGVLLALIKGKGMDWVSLVLEAKEENVTNREEFQIFVSGKEK